MPDVGGERLRNPGVQQNRFISSFITQTETVQSEVG